MIEPQGLISSLRRDTMAAPSNRVPSRTPPFVLIGLLVLLSVLALKYWSLSSDRERLQSELDTITVKSKDLLTQKEDIEVVQSHLHQELSFTKRELEDLRRQTKSNEQVLEDQKLSAMKQQTAVSECQIEQTRCDENLKAKTQEVEALTYKDAEGRKILQQVKAECSLAIENASKTSECKPLSCDSEVKEILSIIAAKVNTDTISKALADGGKDYYKLMENIPVNKNIPENTPSNKGGDAKDTESRNDVEKEEEVPGAAVETLGPDTEQLPILGQQKSSPVGVRGDQATAARTLSVKDIKQLEDLMSDKDDLQQNGSARNILEGSNWVEKKQDENDDLKFEKERNLSGKQLDSIKLKEDNSVHTEEASLIKKDWEKRLKKQFGDEKDENVLGRRLFR